MVKFLRYFLIFSAIFSLNIFAFAEWELPHEFVPPQLFTTINIGLYSPIYYIQPNAAVLDQKWLQKQLLTQHIGNEPMAPYKLDNKLPNSGSESKIPQNLHKIMPQLNTHGCEGFISADSVGQLHLEIGQENITIACRNFTANANASSSAIRNRKLSVCNQMNGTKCQTAKITFSTCQNRSNSEPNAFDCNELMPISLQIKFSKMEDEPDLRASYYQRKGRFYCPSDITCLTEIFFTVDGNGKELLNVLINAIIAVLLVILCDCKINF